MADLSITASAVLAGTNSAQEQGVAGATITAGQAVYLDQTTGKYALADADAGSATARTFYGIALNGASDGQPLRIHKSGDITINAVLTAGVAYYLSDTPGGICPLADLDTGDYYGFVGIAESTTVLQVHGHYSGVAKT